MDDGEELRDLASLLVPATGSVRATGSQAEPYLLVDPVGVPVVSVTAYFRDLQAAGRSAATLRSYGMDLLRWFRFLWATGVVWNQATRAEARDFCRWLQVAGKPARPGMTARPAAAGRQYAPSVQAHSETVLRSFYDFHLDAGTGPIVNPFPLDRARRAGRAHAHHNPMEPYHDQRAGLYRPRLPRRVPRSIPDEEFNEIFARLPSHRDRPLAAFYVSTGARASELLSAVQGGVHPGRHVIAVTRKGTREVQELPASTDAFVWLRSLAGRQPCRFPAYGGPDGISPLLSGSGRFRPAAAGYFPPGLLLCSGDLNLERIPVTVSRHGINVVRLTLQIEASP